jgi:hypothetical protein
MMIMSMVPFMNQQYIGQHQTQVVVVNPSVDAKVSVYLQGMSPRQDSKAYTDWLSDRPLATIRPNGNGSIGGGLVHWDRRFVLIASAPTTVEIVSRRSDFVAEELEPILYVEDGLIWEVARELDPLKAGTRYNIDAGTRLAIRISQKEETTEDAYFNFQITGDAPVQLVQQTQETRHRLPKAPGWNTPAEAIEIVPGGSKAFTLGDKARLKLVTDSPKELSFDVVNSNAVGHQLRLASVDETDTELAAQIVAPALAGRVVISKGRAAIVQQLPR